MNTDRCKLEEPSCFFGSKGVPYMVKVDNRVNEKDELLLYGVEATPDQEEESPDGEAVERSLWERYSDWAEAIDC